MRYLVSVLLVCSLSVATADEADSAEDWGEATTAFDAPQQQDRYADPWEDFNRKMFTFNEKVDKYAAKPVAKGYRKITPGWFNDTVTRFFENMRDLRSSLNYMLQWRWDRAGHDLGRFTINSTLGVAGLFDVASSTNLQKHTTDLGMTFARWGAGEGPYLMLPVLGPSTVRDASALLPQRYMQAYHYVEHDITRWSMTALYGLDKRADLLDLERSLVGDRYTFIRNAYLQQRRFMSGEGDAEQSWVPDEAASDFDDDDGW